MKNIIILIIFIVFSSCSNKTENENKNKTRTNEKENSIIDVEINKNLETLGIILSLASEEYFQYDETLNERAHLLKYILKKFENYKNHPAVKKAKYLIDNDIFYIPNAQIGLYFTDLPEFKLKDDLNISSYYSDTEQVSINEFLELVPSFYKGANIDSFIIAESELYKRIISEAKKSIPDYKSIRTLEDFHGIDMNSYTLIPSPSIPNYYNFGVRIKANNNYDVYYLFGPTKDIEIDSSLVLPNDLGFDNKKYIEKVCIHEYGHSFVGFLDKPENQKLVKSISFLNSDSLKEGQERYGDWSGIFEEHIVRTIEIRVAEINNDTILRNELYEKNVNEKKFLYITKILQIMKIYENDRVKYSKFEDFFPTLIDKMAKITKN